MGGKPKTNTPADQRLKRNNPNAGKATAKPPALPVQPTPQKKPPMKGK